MNIKDKNPASSIAGLDGFLERIKLLLSVLMLKKILKIIFYWLKIILPLASCCTPKNNSCNSVRFPFVPFCFFNTKSLQKNFVMHPKLLFSDHFQLSETLKVHINVIAILK